LAEVAETRRRTLARKQALVDGIREKLESSQAVILVDYCGLTAEQMANLRRQLREKGSELRVVKNTLALRAAQGTSLAQALDLDDSYYHELRQSYQDKRDLMVKELRKLGYILQVPRGTYYIAADISALSDDDDLAYCRALPQKKGVAAIPISAFYQNPQEHRGVIRIAFCKNHDTLLQACERLAQD